MTRLALVVLVAALLVHAWTVAAVAAVPLAVRVGYRAAIRKTGVGMVKAGTRQILTGRL